MDKIARYHYTDPMEFVEKVATYKCKKEYNRSYKEDFAERADRAANALKLHDFEDESALIHGIVEELKTVDFSLPKWKFVNRLTAGSRVDIGRYLNGRQDCWGGFRKQAKAKRTVRVYTQSGGNCRRSKKDLAVSGAIAVTITDILESMGVDVELWICEAGRQFLKSRNNPVDKYVACIRLKESNQFADLGLINYFSGNEDMFRGIGFQQIIMMADMEGEDVNPFLGKELRIDANVIGLDEYEKAHSIIIPSIYNIDEAKTYLTDLINNNLKERMRL